MKEILEYFKNLPIERIDQKKSTYSKTKPCCVGAHLANLLLDKIDYLDGRKGLLKEMKKTFPDINACHIELIFRNIEINNPWGFKRWNITPYEAFEKISEIEKLPDLPYSNLSYLNLKGANLKNINLKNANLENADLEDANLENINLSNANLERANLKETNLENADLKNANLENADLRNANLENADLKEANLENADLRNTNLRNADLRNTNLRNANLKDTNLKNTKSLDIL